MRFIFIIIVMSSINLFAGLQKLTCSNINSLKPVNLCFEYPSNRGTIQIQNDIIQLRFSLEDSPQAGFVLPRSNHQTGIIQLLNDKARVQIGQEEPLYLTCSKFEPGYCK